MDIEKLIERLRTESLYADKASLEIMDLCMDTATALSTLQIENQALRNAANGFKAENEKLRAELESLKKGHCAGCSVRVVETEALRDLNDAPTPVRGFPVKTENQLYNSVKMEKK